MAETAVETKEASKASGPFLPPKKNSLTGVTIVATVYDNSVREPQPRKDGEGLTKGGAFIANELARFDNANEQVGPQFDPALYNEATVDSEGVTRFNKSTFYNSDSLAKFREASGSNTQEIYRHVDGKATDERIGEILVFDATLTPPKDRTAAKNQPLFVRPDTVKPTAIKVPENVQAAQYEAVGADRKLLKERLAEKKLTKETVKEAEPAVEEPATSKVKSNDGPDF